MKISSRLLSILLAIAGFAFNFAEYRPGFMSNDTVDQYGQALRGQYSSWHPPLMAYFWHLLIDIYIGPQVMLVLQLLFLWGSFYVLASATEKIHQVVVLFILFFLAPFIQNFAGYIIKDVQMCLSWLLAISILLRYYLFNKRLSVSQVVLSALLLAYGTWMRHNALSGLITLCLVWSWAVFANRKVATRSVIAIVMVVLIVITGKVGERMIGAGEAHPEGVLLMHDLTAIFVETGEDVYPQSLYENPNFDTAYIRANFHTANFDNIMWPSDHKVLFHSFTGPFISEVKHAWIHAIEEHPWVYLKHRTNAFLYFLRIRNYTPIGYFQPWIPENDYGLKIDNNNGFYHFFTWYMGVQNGLFYFKAWFWLLVNTLMFALIPLIKKAGHKFVYGCILLSGWLYMMPYYLLITVDSDFRYIYWTCIACFLAVIVFVYDNFSRKNKSYT